MTTPTQGEHAQTALAHELFADAQLAPGEGIEDAVRRIAAALTAPPAQPAAPQGVAYAELPEPDSYLFQHDETGLTQFVDAQQVEWGFQQNNPRLRRIGGAYTADKMRDFADRTHALRASHGQAPASRITVEQVEDAIGLQSTAWDTIGAEKIVEAVLRLANGQAPAGATNTKTHALLSTMIGLFLRAKEKIGYQPGSAIDKTVAEAVEHLKDWPYPETATAQAAPAAGAVAGPDDDIDAVALARYKVVPSHDSMFHRFAVVAGDGKQQLYLGRETECQNMARKFAGAFLDGAFHQSQIAAAPTPAAQADSITKERLKELLDKPETVHLNMLHGHIAVITMAQCAHLHGEEMQRKWAAADSVLAECGNCFEGKSDFDHVCKHCGGSGKVADSVLEDAARWQFVESAPSAITLRLHNLRPDQRAQYVDAARKQGAKHD